MRAAQPNIATWTIIGLISLTVGIAATKVFWFDYSFADVLPRSRYTVTYQLGFDGFGGDARVRSYLPTSDSRQTVSDEENNSPGLRFSTEYQGLNRRVTWTGNRLPDNSRISYRLSALTSGIRFELAPDLPLPATYPAATAKYLQPEKAIQVDHPEIIQTAKDIGADRGSLTARLRRIFDFTAGLDSRPFKGTTDALAALRLGEASCNGKSRLFVALARSQGIPARLVGGLLLRTGVKRTSHQWVEAYVAGHWVPFDPTNHRFAELTERYLTLYYDDHSLFSHSRDINFNYQFETTATLVPSPKARASFYLFNIWTLFERLGLSFLLLRTILMLPVGALVVVLFRNVVGLPTFGTFLPALIAAAAGETGLAWGILGVLAIVGISVAVRWVFTRLQLLHSPSLAILLTVVAMTILSLSLAANTLGFQELAYVSLFPIAVMAITAERFYLALTEKGAGTALREMGGTLVVIAACYLVMNSLALQVLVIGFPEVLLLVVAGNVYLGRWVGMRLLEYLRFRKLLATGETI